MDAFHSHCSEVTPGSVAPRSCHLSHIRSEPALSSPFAVHRNRERLRKRLCSLVFFTGDDWASPLSEQCGSSHPHRISHHHKTRTLHHWNSPTLGTARVGVQRLGPDQAQESTHLPGGRGCPGPESVSPGSDCKGMLRLAAHHLPSRLSAQGLGRERMSGKSAYQCKCPLNFRTWSLPLFYWPRWHSVVCWSQFILLARANC